MNTVRRRHPPKCRRHSDRGKASRLFVRVGPLFVSLGLDHAFEMMLARVHHDKLFVDLTGTDAGDRRPAQGRGATVALVDAGNSPMLRPGARLADWTAAIPRPLGVPGQHPKPLVLETPRARLPETEDWLS